MRYFLDLRDPQRDSLAGGYLYARNIISAIGRHVVSTESVRTTPAAISARHRLSHLLVPAMAWGANVYYRLWNELRKMPVRPACPRVALFFDFNHCEHALHVLPALLERWDAVITISETMKSRLHLESGFPLERLWVAPAAPNDALLRAPVTRSPVAAPYYLMVNPGRRHKNWETVFTAFELNAQADAETELVLAGSLRAEEDAILQRWRRSSVRNQIRVLGAVDNGTLAGLYKEALAVVVASTQEGFGMPLAEALSFGTRCVASDIPVFREVGGEAADYFPALDAVRLAELLSSSSTDTARYRQKAAARYSWDASAVATLVALRSVAR